MSYRIIVRKQEIILTDQLVCLVRKEILETNLSSSSRSFLLGVKIISRIGSSIKLELTVFLGTSSSGSSSSWSSMMTTSLPVFILQNLSDIFSRVVALPMISCLQTGHFRPMFGFLLQDWQSTWPALTQTSVSSPGYIYQHHTPPTDLTSILPKLDSSVPINSLKSVTDTDLHCQILVGGTISSRHTGHSSSGQTKQFLPSTSSHLRLRSCRLSSCSSRNFFSTDMEK